MDLGVPQMSMNLAEGNTMRSFGIGMMRQSMDQLEQVGEQLSQMIQTMTPPAAQASLESHTVNIVV